MQVDFKKDVRSLARLWPFIKPYRLSLIGSFVALTFAATAVLAIGSVFRFVDEYLKNQNIDILEVSLVCLGITTTLSLASFARFSIISKFAEKVLADIRLKAFSNLLKHKPHFFEKTPITEITARLTTDATILQTIIGSSGTMAIRNILMLTGSVSMLLYLNPEMTLAVFISIPLIMIPIIIMAKKVKALAKIEQEELTNSTQFIDEALQALPIVQSYNQENRIQQTYDQYVTDTKTAAIKRIVYRAILTAIIIFLIFSFISGLIICGVLEIIRGDTTTGSFLGFTFYAILAASSVGGLSEIYGQLQRASASAQRLFQLVDFDPEESKSNGMDWVKPVEGHIEFQNIDFAYPTRKDISTLNDINLKIEAGQTIAIVGPSGAGKSTLFQLLLRFYDADTGKITLDGEEISLYCEESLRKPFAYVPQNPAIFSTSLRNNILFGQPNATQEQIEAAAAKAAVTDFIDQLPEGYETNLGQKGLRLSDGQKQRIALARAFLTDPKILLLDEATNALDAENEQFIQKVLSEQNGIRTTMIITHRLSTVTHVDRIFVMEKGQIIAQGTHEDLMNDCPLYGKLLKLHIQSEI